MGLRTGGGEMVELASGIDALYLSGHGTVSSGLLDDLEIAKERARAAGKPAPFDMGGGVLLLEPRGWGKYPYRLQSPYGLIGVTDSTRLPPVRVQPLAEHLHAIGPAQSVEWFQALIAGFTSELRITTSRLDVFSDWHGLDLTGDDRGRFVSRGRRRDLHEEAETWTGFEFGRRTTKTICARIYDKTLDVDRKGARWWFDVWGDAYEQGRPVTRVEFEFGREGLKQYGVDTTAQALAAAPGLWKSASTEWLTLRDPNADRTPSRWPVAAEWQAVQEPSFAAGALGLDRVLEGRVAGGLRGIRPSLVGYLATFCAYIGAVDLEAAVGVLLQFVRDYEIVSGVSFADRVAAKRQKLRLV